MLVAEAKTKRPAKRRLKSKNCPKKEKKKRKKGRKTQSLHLVPCFCTKVQTKPSKKKGKRKKRKQKKICHGGDSNLYICPTCAVACAMDQFLLQARATLIHTSAFFCMTILFHAKWQSFTSPNRTNCSQNPHQSWGYLYKMHYMPQLVQLVLKTRHNGYIWFALKPFHCKL